jgi:Fe-S-cluster-containing hydrogenase component 2
LTAEDKNVVEHIEEKCVKCGMCTRTCLFGALTLNEGKLIFNKDKCINCGKCLRICPTTAIVERNELKTAVSVLKSDKHKVAIIAPSIVSQFNEVSYKKLITGIKLLGFDEVVEAAAGADIVLKNETKELSKKGKLISSCCPV